MLCDDRFKERMILSFDVEDNFTKAELKRGGDWALFESQVVDNTARVVALLRKIGADATFFIVGQVAERHPQVVKMIQDAGFEVASHGYAHEPVDQMSPEAFKNDLIASLSILERLTQEKIQGFRARSFSITANSLWAMDILRDHHLKYDSSMTDVALRETEKSGNGQQIENKIFNPAEIPVSARRIFGKTVIVSGGVVLRLLPLLIYRKITGIFKPKNSPPILYAHVWEFNKNQPDRKVGFLQRVAQSSITYTTPSKIERLSRSYQFVSFRSYLDGH